jgi:hypothetical protein
MAAVPLGTTFERLKCRAGERPMLAEPGPTQTSIAMRNDAQGDVGRVQ